MKRVYVKQRPRFMSVKLSHILSDTYFEMHPFYFYFFGVFLEERHYFLISDSKLQILKICLPVRIPARKYRTMCAAHDIDIDMV